jgi:hypothetical protein
VSERLQEASRERQSADRGEADDSANGEWNEP